MDISHINFIAKESGFMKAQFFTIDGRLVQTQSQEITQGENVNLDFLPPTINEDIYICRISMLHQTAEKMITFIR